MAPADSGNRARRAGYTRPRRGRTPSIDTGKIEAAVREAGGAGEVSMKDVAARLGVNVTTLYRHMGGSEGLHRMRAQQLAMELPPPPEPRGLSWQSWMQELASYYREALMRHPELLAFAHAALDPDFEKLEQAAACLVRYGFTPRAAALAHGFMINNVIGFVHSELQAIEDARQGHLPFYPRLVEHLESRAHDLPTLRSLRLDEATFNRERNFARYVKYLIAGIEAQRGSPEPNA